MKDTAQTPDEPKKPHPLFQQLVKGVQQNLEGNPACFKTTPAGRKIRLPIGSILMIEGTPVSIHEVSRSHYILKAPLSVQMMNGQKMDLGGGIFTKTSERIGGKYRFFTMTPCEGTKIDTRPLPR